MYRKKSGRRRKYGNTASAAQWETWCWTQRQNNNNITGNHALSVRARFFFCAVCILYPCCHTLFAINWMCLYGWIYRTYIYGRFAHRSCWTTKFRHFTLASVLSFRFFSLSPCFVAFFFFFFWVLYYCLLVCISHPYTAHVRCVEVRGTHGLTYNVHRSRQTRNAHASFIRK